MQLALVCPSHLLLPFLLSPGCPQQIGRLDKSQSFTIIGIIVTRIISPSLPSFPQDNYFFITVVIIATSQLFTAIAIDIQSLGINVANSPQDFCHHSFSAT